MANYRKFNQEYYDQLEEQQLDPPHAIELARRAARVFRRVYEFDEDETVVMDFACGVGLISRELIPYSKSVVGVDISQRMVDEYNRHALSSFLKPGGSLLVIDLLKDDNLDVDNLFPEHREHDIVAHRGGFTQIEIEDAFVVANLTLLEFSEGIKAKKKGHPVTLFIAHGIKPSVG
ncbi:hypothetical protein P691DRAFT_799616 [Macrolepiota fuliginosa MF-IS2]|uniref:Methyltransferase domain-containing protein n=1 Tax=Macrolepiota fuliginosa MF-IS2 TaxID=1400762 RepID=A0A9P5XMN9_9AGAR|nr:hypothetical protein P691DRAFT_799616 [Macrolepiota fuliginosa MF-IS2]